MTARNGFSSCLPRWLAVAALLASSSSSFAAAADRQPPPNIVFMLADDQVWNGLSSAWEGGIRVPLIIRGPGIAADSWCHLPVVGYDLPPQRA